MNTVLTVLGVLVSCLPLPILAIHEHRTKQASTAEEDQ